MKYILVQWPDSQLLMDYNWFHNECFLANGNLDEVGSSAYFVPEKRYKEFAKDNK